MTSLSTVYFISILLASVSAFGATYLGNMVHPIKGGSNDVLPLTTPREVVVEATKTNAVAETLAATPSTALSQAAENLEVAAEQINTTPEAVPT